MNEPKTLGEAIRMGCKLKTQGKQLYKYSTTCALGAALDALGKLEEINDKPNRDDEAINYLSKYFNINRHLIVSSIENGKNSDFWYDILIANNLREFSREKIADWCDGVLK